MGMWMEKHFIESSNVFKYNVTLNCWGEINLTLKQTHTHKQTKILILQKSDTFETKDESMNVHHNNVKMKNYATF